MVTAREVSELLEERPDLEPSIEAVLEPDPPWDFHDVPIDSGPFGELVSRGIVKKTENGYRVPNPEAVQYGLQGDVQSEKSESRWRLDIESLPVSQLEVAFLTGMLVLLIGFRLLPWATVFRKGHVVLSANDPYFYRYLVEQLLSSPEITPSNLGSGIEKSEPLLVTALWIGTLLLGGTIESAGWVLAWYPIVTAVITAAIVYAIAILITDDRRIGLAAVGMLAVLPGHAFRTSLGFADHHPFDFLWLSITLLGIVLIARDSDRSKPTFSLSTLIGIPFITLGITGQVLAWDNSPLIVGVLGPYLLLESLRSVKRNESPLRSGGPTLAAVFIAAVSVWAVHDRLGWHTELVASAPLLVTVGGLSVLALAELFHRLDLRSGPLAIVHAVAGVAGTYALAQVRPGYWERLLTSVEDRLLAPRPIAEVHSIFDQSFGWLLLFGFILVIALPYLVWASRCAVDDARWLPPVTYAWYFLVLAAIQARFVGELAPSIVVFAGFGFVHLAERIDIARRPAPFTDDPPPSLALPTARQFGMLALLFLLVAGLGMVQVSVKTSQVSTPKGLSDTAFYLAEYSDDRGLEYPENYVFSRWDKNRAYNYFVNGESRSYSYAQANYADFLTSSDPQAWYDRLRQRGFVVVTSQAAGTDVSQIGTLLYVNNGSRTDIHPGLDHYRLIYVSSTGEYKAFELVEGAVLRGQNKPNTTVTANTSVEVPGTSFAYARETSTDASGNYTLRVAHPGTYWVEGIAVTVSPAAVRNGSRVTVSDQERA